MEASGGRFGGGGAFVCIYCTSPAIKTFFIQCSECLQHIVLFPSNYYERN